MSRVKVLDKTFETSMPEAQIKARVKELAQQISKDMEGKNPLFLAVLNGAFIFAADLMREMTIPCEISFGVVSGHYVDRKDQGGDGYQRRHQRTNNHYP